MGGTNKDVYGTKLLHAKDRLDLCCELYSFLSLSEDTALLSVSCGRHRRWKEGARWLNPPSFQESFTGYNLLLQKIFFSAK